LEGHPARIGGPDLVRRAVDELHRPRRFQGRRALEPRVPDFVERKFRRVAVRLREAVREVDRVPAAIARERTEPRARIALRPARPRPLGRAVFNDEPEGRNASNQRGIPSSSGSCPSTLTCVSGTVRYSMRPDSSPITARRFESRHSLSPAS
jgi:hypothetical protein